jgi:NADH:ubiquinone reductase (H+-translocating)
VKRLPWLALAAAAGVGLYGVWHTRSQALVRPATSGPRIVILGAGFGGMMAARELCRRGYGQKARILIVDHHNYHLFTPMLYQVAAWGLDPYNVSYAVREFAGHHGIGFRRGAVTDIDFDGHKVQLQDGEEPYDYLVIALGSTTNYFGDQAAPKHTFPIKWLEDGVAIRNWTIDRVEQASQTADAAQRQALLTFVVIGGGATGVETAAALMDLLCHVLARDYPSLDPSEARVVVVEMLDRLLGAMDQRIADMALDQLRAMGVEVWLKTKATEITGDHITTSDGRTLRTHTVMWTAGVRAPDVIGNLATEHGKGGSIKVDQYLQVVGRRGVFAVGDNASITDAKTGQPVPLLAQSAMQEGSAAGANIARQIVGEPLEPFSYHSLGDALALGRTSGVIASGPIIIGGFPGWLAWRVVHLARLTSYRDKLATVLDWSWGYLRALDTTRLQMQPAPEPATVAGAYHSD